MPVGKRLPIVVACDSVRCDLSRLLKRGPWGALIRSATTAARICLPRRPPPSPSVVRLRWALINCCATGPPTPRPGAKGGPVDRPTKASTVLDMGADRHSRDGSAVSSRISLILGRAERPEMHDRQSPFAGGTRYTATARRVGIQSAALGSTAPYWFRRHARRLASVVDSRSVGHRPAGLGTTGKKTCQKERVLCAAIPQTQTMWGRWCCRTGRAQPLLRVVWYEADAGVPFVA